MADIRPFRAFRPRPELSEKIASPPTDCLSPIGEELVMAGALCDKVLGEEYEVLEKYKGSDFVGKKYQPLFDTFESESDNAFFAQYKTYLRKDDFKPTDKGAIKRDLRNQPRRYPCTGACTNWSAFEGGTPRYFL